MANPTEIPGDLIIPGSIKLTGAITPTQTRTAILSQSDLQVFNVPWTSWRKFETGEMGSPLPGAATSDDLGLVGGTHATGHPSIQAGDIQGTNTARKARVVIAMPWNYVSAQTATLRFYAACLTNAADTTCTLDIIARIMDGDNTVGADVASAAGANNIKTTVFANVDFTLTPTNLSAGTELDVLLSITYEDAGAIEVIPYIGKVQLLCDVL